MSTETKHEPHEPVKRAPVRKAEPKRRGFFATIFSHLAVAAIAVIAVGSYMHWDEILNYTGSRVCAYNVLGKYAIDPVNLPPIDLKKTTEKSTEKATDAPASKVTASKAPEAKADIVEKKTEQQPAKVAPTVEVKKAEVADEKSEAPDEQTQFANALQAARKQFWESDKAAVQAYEALVDKQPKNADLRAELANVYYKNGATKQAIETFFKAGQTFIADKKDKKAQGIVDVLKQVSPEKSAELSKLMNTATN